MATDKEIAGMRLLEAVNLPGGNGLASPAFQTPSLGFFNLMGWSHVEQGTEALICDGEVITATNLNRDLARMIRHKQFMRRVILHPPPLEVSVDALTADSLQAGLSISFGYTVVDPAYVASMAAPLRELSNVAQGVVAEYIRSKTLEELVTDEGTTREALQARLSASRSLAGYYEIVEVHKALPHGDERLIAAAIAAQIARANKALIEAQGENALVQAGTDDQIARTKAELANEIAENEHRRAMEQIKLTEQGQTLRAVVDAVGKAHAAGIPTDMSVLGNLLGAFTQPGIHVESGWPATQNAVEPPQQLPEGKRDNAAREREALASIADDLGILTFDVVEFESGAISGATVQFRDCELVFTCSKDYPSVAPLVVVRLADGSEVIPKITWMAKLKPMLAHLVPVIVEHLDLGTPQAKAEE